MTSHVPEDKFILFLKPATEDWKRLDKSLCQNIERQITKFQDDWGPSKTFSKDPSQTGTEHIYQIKHDRGSMRAFAAWWNGDSIHVLCILSLYKKINEEENWENIDDYDEIATDYFRELSQLHDQGGLRDKLEELYNNGDYRVITP